MSFRQRSREPIHHNLINDYADRDIITAVMLSVFLSAMLLLAKKQNISFKALLSYLSWISTANQCFFQVGIFMLSIRMFDNESKTVDQI